MYTLRFTKFMTNSIHRGFLLGHSLVVALLISLFLFGFYIHEKRKLENRKEIDLSLVTEAAQREREKTSKISAIL